MAQKVSRMTALTETWGEGFTRREKNHLDIMQRRADFLAKRLAETGKEGDSFLRHELAALIWAIDRIAGR